MAIFRHKSSSPRFACFFFRNFSSCLYKIGGDVKLQKERRCGSPLLPLRRVRTAIDFGSLSLSVKVLVAIVDVIQKQNYPSTFRFQLNI